jgi:hypothetical protein
MRPSPLLGGLAGLLALAAPAAADEALYTAVVVQPEAEVRCLPGDNPQQAYVTNRLRRGDTVQVLHVADNGWLAIRPPEGSVSWINTRFVQRISPNYPDNWVVCVHQDVKAPVLIGSEQQPGVRPTVEGARLPLGAQVHSVGRRQVDEEGSWLLIEPPPGEVRYVRAEAVQRTAGPPAPAAVAAAPPQPAVLPPFAAAAAPAPAAGVAARPAAPLQASPAPVNVDAHWLLGLQAEQQNRIAEAISWYRQVAAEAAQSNPDLARRADQRALWLQQAFSNPNARAGVVPPGPGVEARFSPAAGQGRLAQPAAARPPTVRLAPPGGEGSPNAAAAPQPQQAAWAPGRDPLGYPASGPGRLRRAGLSLDGRQAYVLESSVQNCPRLYVVPQAGVDLEPYVNQGVELFGPAVYRGDLRANYMTAVRVQPLP